MFQLWTSNNACPTKMQKRIAIYGGTFDPVHAGHLEIARTVTQLFEIDEFLFVPARQAPHKQDAKVSSAFARYAMLVLAIRHDERFRVSTVELESGATQYTIDTLQQLRAQFGATADLFFVMGSDSWMEITSWREWERLLALTNHIVVTRPGYEFTADQVGPIVASRVADVRGQAGSIVGRLVETGRPRIFVTDAVMRDVSATDVRGAARENRVEDLQKLTTPEVAQYITNYRLYRNSNEA